MKKRTRTEWQTEIDALSSDEADMVKEMLKKRLANSKNDRESEALKNYILSEWDNCERLRRKIGNEGTHYFYNHYTTVPVKYSTYSLFVNDEMTCWCGTCDESSEEESTETSEN